MILSKFLGEFSVPLRSVTSSPLMEAIVKNIMNPAEMDIPMVPRSRKGNSERPSNRHDMLVLCESPRVLPWDVRVGS